MSLFLLSTYLFKYLKIENIPRYFKIDIFIYNQNDCYYVTASQTNANLLANVNSVVCQ